MSWSNAHVLHLTAMTKFGFRAERKLSSSVQLKTLKWRLISGEVPTVERMILFFGLRNLNGRDYGLWISFKMSYDLRDVHNLYFRFTRDKNTTSWIWLILDWKILTSCSFCMCSFLRCLHLKAATLFLSLRIRLFSSSSNESYKK